MSIIFIRLNNKHSDKNLKFIIANYNFWTIIAMFIEPEVMIQAVSDYHRLNKLPVFVDLYFHFLFALLQFYPVVVSGRSFNIFGIIHYITAILWGINGLCHFNREYIYIPWGWNPFIACVEQYFFALVFMIFLIVTPSLSSIVTLDGIYKTFGIL